MPASARFTIRVVLVVPPPPSFVSWARLHTVIIVGRVCWCGEVDGAKNDAQSTARAANAILFMDSLLNIRAVAVGFCASLFGLLLTE